LVLAIVTWVEPDSGMKDRGVHPSLELRVAWPESGAPPEKELLDAGRHLEVGDRIGLRVVALPGRFAESAYGATDGELSKPLPFRKRASA
jgi:hypothetical protein